MTLDKKNPWTKERRDAMMKGYSALREMRLDQIVEILDHFRKNTKIEGLNHNDLASEMEMNRKSIRPYVNQLLEDGTIIKKGDKYVLS